MEGPPFHSNQNPGGDNQRVKPTNHYSVPIDPKGEEETREREREETRGTSGSKSR